MQEKIQITVFNLSDRPDLIGWIEDILQAYHKTHSYVKYPQL